MNDKVRLSMHTSQVAHQAEAFPGLKRLRVFLLPPGWEPPSFKFAGGERHRGSSVLPKNTKQCPRPGFESGPYPKDKGKVSPSQFWCSYTYFSCLTSRSLARKDKKKKNGLLSSNFIRQSVRVFILTNHIAP